MPEYDEQEMLAVANEMADAARVPILRHFRSAGLSADNKLAEGFDPVTIADKEAEATMRAVLANRRPDDGIFGEEAGQSAGTSGLTWVLDPIDGTRGFLAGTPVFGVLIALHDGERPVLGVIDQPYIGERFAGWSNGATLTRGDAVRDLRTRRDVALEQAIVMTTFPEVGTPQDKAGFDAVAGHAKLVRYGMDCYGYALVALGQVDLVIESGLNAYDIQGPIGVIEAAGGVVTNWRGDPCDQGGQAIAAGCPKLHAAALKLLAPFAD